MLKKAIFITIRKDSSRLPNQAVRTILGHTVMELVIKRAKLAKEFDAVVVCTTTRQVDDEIADIAAANGATDHADLDFIAWHGITPEKIAAGISEMKCDNKFQPVVHNLAGQRLSGLQKGLNIVDGKKILVK